MKAKSGDRIILAPPTVDGPLRDGEVLETRGPDGGPPYLVRWTDGHEGLFYPGPGSVLRIGPEETAVAKPSAREAQAQPLTTPPATGVAPHVRDWQIRVSIYETDADTDAQVVLVSDSPTHLTARGHSHRSADDRTVPEIGDEVAVARALRRLADELLAAAAEDIEQVTGEHDVALRGR